MTYLCSNPGLANCNYAAQIQYNLEANEETLSYFFSYY